VADVAPVVRTLSQEQLHAYADAAGDHNPIHIDPAFAKATPFGGTIAHGMLVLALVGEMMHGALGGDWLERGALKVRFKAPARPGDTVTARATSSGDRAWTVECVNAAGDVLLEGRATLREPA
jgi:3-hydroxybutyryl-CoA dehydratase